MKIILTESQKELFKSGSVINTNEETYYFFPFWIKECDGEFELVKFEDLPQNVVDIIKEERTPDAFIKFTNDVL